MSLPLLVVMVALGIAAIVAAVHFTGGSARRTIGSAEEAMRLFLADFPAEKVESVWLTLDGGTAFLPLHGEGIGVVQSVGARFLTRFVTARDIAAIELRDDAAISIRFRDFTWPGGTFRFADMAAARAVLDSLPQPRSKGETHGLR